MLAQIIKFFSQLFSKTDVVRDHEKSSNAVPHSDEALELFLGYLKAEGATRSTLKNYSSDISQFVATANKPQLNDLFDISQLELFFKEQESKGLKYSSIQRKFASIKQFAKWLSQQGWLDPQALSNLPFFDTGGTPPSSPATSAKFFAFKGWKNIQSSMRSLTRVGAFSWVTALQLFALVLFSSFLVLFGYKQFFSQAITSQAYPTAPVRPGRFLSFQGRLTDTVSNPIVTATNLSFKLFTLSSGGTELWSSGTCSIDPDQDGIFSTQLGNTCGSELAASIFSENSEVWLEVTVGAETLTPRQRIATVAYALNTETLQGFPVSATESATANTVAVMNEWGEIVLGENSPKIKSVSGNFAIEGRSITFQTAAGSNGNINISPDGTGRTLINSDLNVSKYATISASLSVGTLGAPAGPGNAVFSGNVGIGIAANQTNKLIISGSATGAEPVFKVTNTANSSWLPAFELLAPNMGNGQNNYFSLGKAATNYNRAAISYYHAADGSTSNRLNFGFYGADGLFNLLASGNVGIGDTTPAYMFTVGSGDLFGVNSSGAIAAATGITSSGTITFSGLTNGIVKANSGVLSGGNTVTLTSEVSGILPIANGGTNASTIGSAGSLAYSTGSAYAFTAVGSNGQCLISAGSGTPTWGSCAGGLTNYWNIADGALYALNTTTDFLIGGTATSSAKFAVLNVNSGTPTASVSAGTNGAMYMTADGTLGTTRRNTLTIGNSSTYNTSGNILINPNGTGNVGIGTDTPTTRLNVQAAAGSVGVRVQPTDANTYTGLQVSTPTNSTNYTLLESDGGAAQYRSRLMTVYTGGQNTDWFFQNSIGENEVYINMGRSTTTTSTKNQLSLSSIFNGSSTNTYAGLRVNPTINQTGSGITRGIYINPTLTAAADWRGVDIANNSGYGVYQSGASAQNYFAGNVGIGTTTPTALLDVAGNASSSGTLSFRGTTDPKINILNGEHFGIRTSGGGDAGLTERLTVLNNGNVGIGTTSPTGTLTLVRNNYTSGIRVENNGFTTSAFDVANSGTVNSAWRYDGKFQAASGSQLSPGFGFYSDSDTGLWNSAADSIAFTTAGTTKAVLNSSGNLGIGDTTPAALFTVGNGDLFQVNSSGNVIVASTIGVSGDTDLLSLASNALTVNGSITATSTITGTTLNGTTGINTGAGAGTQRIDNSGNLTNIGTTQFNGVTYTWPGADGTAGQVLSTNGSGTLSWTGAATDASIHWTLANGALFPKNSTVDFLIGGQATSSAKFAVLNVDSGTPTASVSAGATGAIYITAAGTIQTTNNQNLTIGGNTTGNIFLLPRNSAGRVGINTTSPNGAFDIKSTGLNSTPLTVTASDGSALINILEDPSGNGYLGINDAGGTFRAELYAVGNAGQLALRAGGLTTFISANSDTYFNGGNVGIGDTSPASLFTVGSGDLFEINSSGTITDVRGITNTGAITSTGGIFSINDSSNFATNINTGTSTGALSLGGGSGTIAVNSTSWDISTAGVASGFTGITSSGTITFSGLSDGIVKSTSGVLSGGNLIDLTADVTGILPIANGGTNANSIGSAGSVAYSTGTAYAFSSVGTTGECLISGGTGTPTWGACDDPTTASKWNITNGTLTPINHTLDLLVGGGATDSAKFAVLNVNSGTPTASVSAGVNGGAFLTADGTLSTTNRQSLTIGNSSAHNTSGNILMNPNGTGFVGIGTTNPLYPFHMATSNATSGIGARFTNSTSGATNQAISAFASGATLNTGVAGAAASGTQNIGISGTATGGTGLNIAGSFSASNGTSGNTGIQISVAAGTSNYSIYSIGDAKSYFEGNVGIGDLTPAALLTVGDGDLFQVDGSGNITTAADLAVNGGDITSTGSLTLTPTSTLTLNSTGNLTLDSSADIILDADGADWIFSDGGATIATFTNSSTDLNLNIAGGQLVLANTNTINIGGTSNRAYNSISDSTAATFASSDNDLYVEDILEVGTALYVGGKQISSNALWQNTLNVYHPGYEYAGVADLAIGGTSTASAKLHINATTGEISGNGTAVIINDDIQIKGGDILGNSGSTRITVDDATSKTIVTGSLDVTSVFRSGSAFQFQVDASGNLTTSGSITTDVRFAGNASDTNSTPSFTWAGDTTTGMYRTGASAIAWSLGGTQRMTLSGTTFGLPGVTTISASSLTTFTASANLSFGSTNLTTTGNITGAVLNGTTGINTGASAGTLRINASGDLLNIRAITSNSSAPSTGDLGLYSSGSTSWMRFTSNNGIFKWYSDYTEGTSSGPTANSEILALTPTGQLIGNAGTAAAPTFTFEGSTTTGMYLPAASQLAWSTGGTQRMLLTSTGLAVTGAIDASTQFLGQASDVVTTPSFSWTGDTTTGMYRTGASAIAWSLGGTQRMTLSGTTFGLPGVTTLSATSLSTINAASSLSISSNVSVNTLATANDTGGVLTVGRQNNISEGGQISLVGASTFPNWEIDSQGGNLRFFTTDSNTRQVQMFNGGTGDINLNVTGNILTSGTQRLSSAGALSNITTISASGNITTSARFYGAGDGVGSVSAPTYSFSGATNYGMFFTTTGPTGMVFTTAGSESFRVTGSGVILTPQTADGAVCNANNEGKVSYDADGSMEGRLFVCHSWSGGFRWTWLSYNTGTNPDLAENTRVNDLSIDAGDLVGVSDEEITTGDIYYRFSAQKATKTNAAKGMLGVISTKPGILLGEESTQVIGDHSTDPYLRPLTLAGRVPVKVVTQQKIEKGDRIGVSSYAGVGEVLTSAGHSVGSSLTTFDPATATCQNVNSLQDIAWSKNDEDFNNCYRLPSGEVARKIMVMVNNEYYYGDIALNDDGLILSNYAIQSQEDQQQTLFQLVEQSTQNIIQKVSTFSELLVANIQAGLVKSQQLNTNLIAPLDQQDLRVMIGNNMMPGSGKFVIENRNQQEVFSIDEQGTATLSGNLNVNQDASISGQLTATSARLQQLESRLAEIDQLKVNTATISGQLYLADGRTIESMLADNANFLATQSAAPQEVPAGSYDNFLSQLTGANDATIADLLATLYQEENIELTSEDVVLNADGVFIHQYLGVRGLAQLETAQVSGLLTVGGNLLISNNSIATLSDTLEIQPTGNGTIRLLAGLMTLSDTGHVVINGDLTVSGTLAAGQLNTNTLQPDTFGEDLQVKLATTSAVLGESVDSQVSFTNQNNETVASINAEGSGRFRQLITQGVILASDEDAANTTAGKQTLAAGQTEMVINNNTITEDSLIYITPTSDTQNQVLFVKAKEACTNQTECQKNFTVGINAAITQAIEFNYWIVAVQP